MGRNQENLTFTDPETGELFTLNTSSLVSNVRDILLSRRKMQAEATVWSKLKEAEQKDEITAMQELARDLVGKVAERVAERDQETDAKQETAPEPDKSDPYEAGQQARVEGLGPDDNPHDGGTEDGNAWAEGYSDADGEIDQLKQQGYEARKDGLALERNPWKAKTRENAWWAEGYDKAKAEGLPEE